MDVVIPIVYPDYRIAVSTPAKTIKLPKALSKRGLPSQITIPAQKQKLPYLGHAGVLFINGKSGLTKYYEYGRYDAAALGWTRKVTVPDVKIDKSGKPTEKSLASTLAVISTKAGQNGRISAAYIEIKDGKFKDMLVYAEKRVSQNNNSKRDPYTLVANSCMHFSKEVAEAGGATIPWILDPRPNSFIGEVQSEHPALEFSPPDNLTIDGINLP
jgi:hypothetical protein